MKNFFRWNVVVLSFLILSQSIACKQDEPESEPEPEVIADFSYGFNTSDLRIVTFTSKAKNYENLAWDFGDTSAISNEINPVHIYNFAEIYTVILNRNFTLKEQLMCIAKQ